jgi:RNase P subunit RPR2
MVVVGMTQMGLASLAMSQEFQERFPAQSIPGLREEWNRMNNDCYGFLINDIGNKDLADIHKAMRSQIRECKTLLTAGKNLLMKDVELCHRAVDFAFQQCREAAKYPEQHANELPTETFIGSSRLASGPQ